MNNSGIVKYRIQQNIRSRGKTFMVRIEDEYSQENFHGSSSFW